VHKPFKKTIMKKVFTLITLLMLGFASLTAMPALAQQKPATSQHVKKDGTPDKRYNENKHLKKNGTPDMRYNTSKKAGAKASKPKNPDNIQPAGMILVRWLNIKQISSMQIFPC
jgi:hypothetical protein